jgi:uncharacterized membrane protein
MTPTSTGGRVAAAKGSASFNLFRPFKGPFRITMLVGIAVGLGMQVVTVEVLGWHPFTGLMVYWLTVAYVYLVPTWILALRRTPGLQAAVQKDGGQRRSVGVLLIPAVGFELVIVALVLPQANTLGPEPQVLLIATCAAAVASAWLVTQTAHAVQYAWVYYNDLHQKSKKPLVFTETESPDYWDFFYFACAVGTTFGTTDVQVASQAIRRTVLRQGLLSFIVNTVFLAMIVAFLGELLGP